MTETKPMRERVAVRFPRQSREIRAWRKMAYTNQVIKDQVSLGSQLQYAPQA
jgi:hypothetical protein